MEPTIKLRGKSEGCQHRTCSYNVISSPSKTRASVSNEKGNHGENEWKLKQDADRQLSETPYRLPNDFSPHHSQSAVAHSSAWRDSILPTYYMSFMQSGCGGQSFLSVFETSAVTQRNCAFSPDAPWNTDTRCSGVLKGEIIEALVYCLQGRIKILRPVTFKEGSLTICFCVSSHFVSKHPFIFFLVNISLWNFQIVIFNFFQRMEHTFMQILLPFHTEHRQKNVTQVHNRKTDFFFFRSAFIPRPFWRWQ